MTLVDMARFPLRFAFAYSYRKARTGQAGKHKTTPSDGLLVVENTSRLNASTDSMTYNTWEDNVFVILTDGFSPGGERVPRSSEA
jgi:hypothetical protein